MGRTRQLALIAAIAMLAALVVAGPASAAPRCTEPEPVLTYGAESINLTLTVDYTGCGWWRKSTINLEGAVTQGPVFGVGIAAGSSCFVFREGGSRAIARTCEIHLAFDHPPVEAATYSGYFEYPWKNGTAHIDFEYTSATAAGIAECL